MTLRELVEGIIKPDLDLGHRSMANALDCAEACNLIESYVAARRYLRGIDGDEELERAVQDVFTLFDINEDYHWVERFMDAREVKAAILGRRSEG